MDAPSNIAEAAYLLTVAAQHADPKHRPAVVSITPGAAGPGLVLLVQAGTSLPEGLRAEGDDSVLRWEGYPVEVRLAPAAGHGHDAVVLDASPVARDLARAWAELSPFAQRVLATAAELLVRGSLSSLLPWLTHLTATQAAHDAHDRLPRRPPVPEVSVRSVYLAGLPGEARDRVRDRLECLGFEVSVPVHGEDARSVFGSRVRALREAQATILLLPGRREDHLALGYAAARGQRTVVLGDAAETQPLHRLAHLVTSDMDAVVRTLWGARPETW